jgi:hypothetical protein
MASGSVANRSGSAISMSSATAVAPFARTPSIKRAMTSRRHGHCPTSATLRSSISTIAMPDEAAGGGTLRTNAS